MNFKKNFKRFFTLSRNAEGFTLVELIVVIAILGILSVVAVPAYSQYVQKSQLGVDKSQLGVVNSLFAVSLVNNGKDPAQVEDAKLQWDSTGKKVTGLASLSFYSVTKSGSDASADSEVVTAIKTEFAAGLNGGLEFKIYTADKVTFAGGCFVGPDMEGTYAVYYGDRGGTINLNINDLNNLGDSTFINSTLGTQGLLDKVNDVTEFAANLGGSDVMQTIFGSNGFQQMAAGALGLENPNADTFNAKFDELAKEMVKKYPDKYSGESALADAKAQLQANAAVLYAAQKSTNMNKADITAMLSKENAGTDLVASLKGDADSALANAALAYGMYTAYAYSTGDQDKIDSTSSFTNMAANLNDKNFRDWVGSEQGQKDMDAYLSAMNMIESSATNEAAVSDLMVNGFNDPNLVKLINQALGSK